MTSLIFVLIVILVGVVIFLARSFVKVPDGQVGVVYKRFGPPDKHPFKIQVGAGSGYQAVTLMANRFYLRPSWLYRVKFVPRTYVPASTIGVVLAKDGALPPPHRTLGKPVPCNYFQDAQAFLLGGGEQGRQLEILPGGAYYDINPYVFEVLTVATIGKGRYDLTAQQLIEIHVPEGSTGVVITREGKPSEEGSVGPVVPGHHSFQWPSVFLHNGGRRGAQAETLSHGGLYRINPWFARVVIIPTRDLILEWTRRPKSPENFDVALDQIRINVEGYWLRFDMSQTIRIPSRSAPVLVSRFGELDAASRAAGQRSDRAPVQRFVEKVLGRTVEGYFQSVASGYKALEFIANHNEVRLQVETKIRQALAEWGVIAVLTTLNEFEPEERPLHDLLQALAAERHQRPILELERENALLRAERDRIQIEVDKDRAKIQLQAKIELLGHDRAALEVFLAHLATMKVPNVISSGGGAEELLQYLPLTIANNMINSALNGADETVRADASVGPAPTAEPIEPPPSP
jgi:hypothetical protein